MKQAAFNESQFMLASTATDVELDPAIASQIANEVYAANNRFGIGKFQIENNHLWAPETPIIVDTSSETPSYGVKTSRRNKDETVGYHINMSIDPIVDSPTRYNSLFAGEMLKALDSDERIDRAGVSKTLGFISFPVGLTLGGEAVALGDNSPQVAAAGAVFGTIISASVVIPGVHNLYRRAVTRPEATLAMLRREIAAHHIAKLGLEPMLKTEQISAQ